MVDVLLFRILLRGHYHNFGAVGLEGFLNHVQGIVVHAQCCGRFCIDGHDAVVEGLIGQVGGGLTLAEQLHYHIGGGLAQLDVIHAVAHKGTVQCKAVRTSEVHHACIGKGLIDGQLGGHHGVVGGGEHCLDTGSHKGLSSHLHLGGGGTVLFNVLDALAVAERLGIGDGWVEGILAQVVQQTDGVNVGVDGSDEVHNGLGVQGIGGAGDALLPVKPGRTGSVTAE